MLRKISSLLLTSLLFSLHANAAQVPLSDWWLQTDNFGGLRQISTGEPLFYAVFTQAHLSSDIAADYELPPGFHWATIAEVEALLPASSSVTHYANQGGWTNYTHPGETANRVLFYASDSVQTLTVIHAGQQENQSYPYSNAAGYASKAGLLLIQDSNTAGSVAIAGGTSVGETITATVTDADGFSSVTYLWKSNGADVGTNQNTYITANSDIGNSITVDVSYADDNGFPENTSSNSIGPIQALVPNLPPNPAAGSSGHFFLLILGSIIALRQSKRLSRTNAN
ncbi:Uncharacterised protein [BD1-7 clade bacterium]|nr:Uncharacterised protein [BD1-7 clade bacterium]